MQGLIHTSPQQFKHLLLLQLQYLHHNKDFYSVGKSLSFADQILMTFIWIVQYPRYSLLGGLFGTSVFTVSSIISTLIPLLVEFFAEFIPNQIQSQACSHLNHIVAH